MHLFRCQKTPQVYTRALCLLEDGVTCMKYCMFLCAEVLNVDCVQQNEGGWVEHFAFKEGK